jgi:hypothetical protein
MKKTSSANKLSIILSLKKTFQHKKKNILKPIAIKRSEIYFSRCRLNVYASFLDGTKRFLLVY